MFFCLFFLSGQCQASGTQNENSEEILTISEGVFLLSASEIPPDFSSSESQPVTLPDFWEESRYQKGGSGWYRFTIHQNQVPEKLWGIYLPKLVMNAAVYFNGNFLGDGGSFQEPLGRSWNRPLLFSIPPGLWRPEVNTLSIHLVGYPGDIQLAPVQVGPFPTLKRAYDFRTLLQTRIITALFPVTLTVSVFMIGLYLRRRREPVYLWFGLAVLAWALSNLNFFVRDIGLPSRIWEVLALTSIAWWNYFLSLFVLRFLGYKRPRLEKLFTAHVVAGTVILCFAPLDQMKGISRIWFALSLLIAIYYISLMLRQWLLKKRKELAVLATSLILIWLFTFHDLLHLSRYFSHNYAGAFFLNLYASPFFFIFMAWHITGRFITALDESDRLNRELEGRVQEARQELEMSHQKLLDLEKKAVVVKERARISREIHDGLGGNFSNAIALVDLIERKGDAQGGREEISHLRTVLNDGFVELRNLILAMEGEVAVLGELCALIREKTRKIAETASLECDLKIDIGAGDRSLPQSLSLNLLRILQEALTNVIKHAGADRIDLRITCKADQLYFELRDDGCGFDASGQGKGYGLRNMNRRCREMGAALKIASNRENGTCLSFSFSLSQLPEETG